MARSWGASDPAIWGSLRRSGARAVWDTWAGDWDATFRSTELRVDGDHATLQGALSLAGQTHPVELQARREGDGTVVGHAEIIESAWGIKPYTGFLGALKLRDAVDLDVSVPLQD